MEIDKMKWSTLKGALITVVVIGHFCQLFVYRDGAGGGYTMRLRR